ncbi:hypothetical protein D3C72_1349250 [compost metagenome]
MAAHRIDRTGPALPGDRRARFGQRVPVDHLGRAEFLQVVGLVEAAGRGHHAVAQPGQQRDRDGTGATIGTGDQDVAVRRGQAAVLQREHGQHRGVARRTDCHRLAGTEGIGHLHQPVAGHPRPLREATVVGLAQAVAVDQHAVTGRDTGVGRMRHHAGQVDAGNQREGADHRRVAGDGQGILVVDRRVVDGDRHLAGHQVALGQIGQCGGDRPAAVGCQ